MAPSNVVFYCGVGVSFSALAQTGSDKFPNNSRSIRLAIAIGNDLLNFIKHIDREPKCDLLHGDLADWRSTAGMFGLFHPSIVSYPTETQQITKP